MGLMENIPFFNCNHINTAKAMESDGIILHRRGFKQVTFNKTIKRITRKRTEVPIWEKATLTLEEAAEFSGIGIHKIRELTEAKNCKFVLWNGSRRLIKRKKFEEFIDGSFSI